MSDEGHGGGPALREGGGPALREGGGNDPLAALDYATRIATALWEKHHKKDRPDWKPLPELMGLLTQIDDMTWGLSPRRQGLSPRRRGLRR
jgi:hypothetical protein